MLVQTLSLESFHITEQQIIQKLIMLQQTIQFNP